MDRPEGSSTPKGAATPALFGHPREDVLASIVVFLVALPLCIGIAVAVGVSPGIALISGIVGGIVVGFLSGAPLQVSGPAAGLFVIVAELVRRQQAVFQDSPAAAGLSGQELEAAAMHYALLSLGVATLYGGLIQVAAGYMRLGQWFRAVSPAVIKGMLAGIGILIILSQVHVMLDHEAMYGEERAHGGLQYLLAFPDAVHDTIYPDGDGPAHEDGGEHQSAAFIGLLTILVLVLWERFAPKRLKLIPAALVAIMLVTALATFADMPVFSIEVPRNLLSDVTLPELGRLSMFFDAGLIQAGIVIALVASAETLLCATAVDQMQNHHKTNYDKELVAQGVGNSICGFLGAIPITGVIVRSTANVSAGAHTRLSTILHGVWLLVFVVALPHVLTFVPRAALGAMLVYIGFKLVNIKGLIQLWKLNKAEAAIFVVTTLIIVLEDLLLGVIVGIGLAAAKLLWTFTHLEIEKTTSPDSPEIRIHLKGAATFIRLPQLARELESQPVSSELHVDLHDLDYIDHACLELLMSHAQRHEKAGGSLVIDWESLHAKFHREGGANRQSQSAARRSAPATDDTDTAAAQTESLQVSQPS